MITVPLIGVVYKRDNGEVQKFLKSLTEVTETWKCIEKFRGVCQQRQTVCENYDGAAEGVKRTN